MLLGVRHFRNLVSDGDLVLRLARWIDATAFARLNRSTLGKRKGDSEAAERLHWAWLLGSVPAAVWAMIVGEPWFAVYLVVASIPFHGYPILLQRHMGGRLARIHEHDHSRATGEAAEPAVAASPDGSG